MRVFFHVLVDLDVLPEGEQENNCQQVRAQAQVVPLLRHSGGETVVKEKAAMPGNAAGTSHTALLSTALSGSGQHHAASLPM